MSLVWTLQKSAADYTWTNELRNLCKWVISRNMFQTIFEGIV